MSNIFNYYFKSISEIVKFLKKLYIFKIGKSVQISLEKQIHKIHSETFSK